MDEKREQFLTRLRGTFRLEAADHLDSITAGLLVLERGHDAERATVVERIFRDAHSLKGAARSVSLTLVETLCSQLESIFAALKSNERELSTQMLDTIRPALGVLADLCANPNAEPPPEVKERQKEALLSLMLAVRTQDAPPMTESSADDPASRDVNRAAAPALAVAPVPPPKTIDPPVASPRASAPEAVRVSTRKIGDILLESEELVGAKLAAAGRAAALRALAASLADWNQHRFRETAQKRRGHRDATAVSEILDSEMLHNRTLESSLRTLSATAQHDAASLSAIADRLLEDTKKLLLLPCSYLLGTLPMVVRDLAREQGKEAELRVQGEDIEIDRRVLDDLKDPLIHLLRNGVDHGIEKPETRRQLGKPGRGSITITATSAEGNRVELMVADDGGGIDAGRVGQAAVRLGLIPADEAESLTGAEAARLIFKSGFTTSPIITDLSGRGLGLAIVRQKVERLGGTITVTSIAGAGTAFRMLVPLSVATFRGVFVEVAGRGFVIPTASVERVGRVKPDQIKTVENRRTMEMGARALSLVRLRDLLALKGHDPHVNSAARPVVVVRSASREIALIVDEVQGEREVMVKGLGSQLPRVRHIAGVAASGSGAITPILNVADLMESASTVGAPGPDAASEDGATGRIRRLLIAEDSITARTLIKSILETAGYEVTLTVDGIDALTRLKSETFDLVVSDVDMPRMNGFELTARIRADQKLAELPVVLCTALNSQKDREYGIEVGANAYIVKSDFDQSNLIEIVGRLL